MDSVMREILDLAQLADVAPATIQHFFTGRDGSGDVTFKVPKGKMAAVTSIEFTNVDAIFAQTVQAKHSSTGPAPITKTQQAQVVAKGPLLYVYKQGSVTLTFTFTPSGGATAHVQVSGYFLPVEAYERLSHNATLQLL